MGTVLPKKVYEYVVFQGVMYRIGGGTELASRSFFSALTFAQLSSSRHASCSCPSGSLNVGVLRMALSLRVMLIAYQQVCKLDCPQASEVRPREALPCPLWSHL